MTRAARGTAGSGAKGLIACLRLLFADKGVPDILSSDGGTEFTSAETKAFLKTWQVKHRLSSAHFPQSNGRAEAAVKSAKRLLRNHCTPSGHLDTDGYMLAIMAHRNTNDPETKISPAMVIYGRRLTDAFKFMTRTDKFSDEAVQPAWRQAWELKERANRHRFFSQREQTNKTSRPLAPLPIGAKVFIQNQHGAQKGAWDRTEP